ncbi:MAG: RNA-binding protein [Thaumarchaeota archaeon]|nr:RNA-binding protein [Nitrososphaerota archaeon]
MAGLKVRTLSKSESKAFLRRVREELGFDAKGRNLKVLEDGWRLVVGENFEVLEIGGKLMPSLRDTRLLSLLPYVEVDRGAIPHVCNGANVMRPGITSMSDFEKGALVAVKDDRYKKFLALGFSEVSSEEAKGMKKGVVVRNVHYVGDRVWKAYSEFSL